MPSSRIERVAPGSRQAARLYRLPECRPLGSVLACGARNQKRTNGRRRPYPRSATRVQLALNRPFAGFMLAGLRWKAP